MVLDWRHQSSTRHVPGTNFWNGGSTLKQYFVLPKNGSKYYLKYTFLVFPVLGILGLGTSLSSTYKQLPGVVSLHLKGYVLFWTRHVIERRQVTVRARLVQLSRELPFVGQVLKAMTSDLA